MSKLTRYISAQELALLVRTRDAVSLNGTWYVRVMVTPESAEPQALETQDVRPERLHGAAKKADDGGAH